MFRYAVSTYVYLVHLRECFFVHLLSFVITGHVCLGLCVLMMCALVFLVLHELSLCRMCSGCVRQTGGPDVEGLES